MDEIISILTAIGLPYAYDHFTEGDSPQVPYIVYTNPAAHNFAADGKAYFKANEIHIELYTDYKDLSVESSVEAVLDQRGIFYDKTEEWIETERLYEVLYTFELEA